MRATRLTTATPLTRLAVLLLLLSPVPAHAQHAALATLSGDQHEGRLVEIAERQVVIRNAQGEQAFDAEQIHWLRLASPDAAAHQTGFVELADGSHVPAEQLLTEGKQVQLTLPDKMLLGKENELTMPYQQVSAYVFSRGDDSLQSQWRRLRSSRATADLIVVKRRDGQTLDSVEGIVTGVTPTTVGVLLDGEPIEVSRARVYGVVCFRPDAVQSDAEGLLRVRLATGPVVAARVDWRPDGDAAIQVAGLGELRAPLASIQSIDFSRGGVLMLGDITPAEVSWRPAFEPPSGFDLIEKWGLMRVNRSYSGGPLMLRESDGTQRRYAAGLAIRSQGSVVYNVSDGFSYFRARIGLDPQSAPGSEAVLRVTGDDQELFARPFVAGEPALEIELPIAGVTRLQLRVDYGRQADSGDNLHVANARLTK